jgi:hypothetical protein
MTLRQYSKLGMQYRFAAMSQMGENLHTQISSANNDEGRAHQRTVDNPQQQTNNAFDQHARQVQLDGFDSTTTTPVGSNQSKVAVDLDALVQSSPVPVKRDPRAKIHGGGFYSRNMIGVDDNLDQNVLAHEIGHAKTDQSTLGRLVQHPLGRGLHQLSPVVGLGLGPYISGTGKERALKAIGISLAMAAPTLASEASASYHGYQTLKEHGATDEELRSYLKALIAPQSTYLIRPTISGLLMHYPYTLKTKTSAKKLDARTTFKNLDISIETDKGNYREWYDPHTDTKGRTLMKYPYGYIRMSEGLDGDHVDCFVGPNEDATAVYVITTNKGPDFKQIDEQKCMLGFNNAEEAKDAFLAHYTDKRFFNKMTALPYAEFEKKVLATREQPKKIANTNTGTFNDQVPGDYLGFPASSLVGLRHVVGDPLTPQDKINKSFRFHDLNMNTHTLDPSASAVPSSPSV